MQFTEIMLFSAVYDKNNSLKTIRQNITKSKISPTIGGRHNNPFNGPLYTRNMRYSFVFPSALKHYWKVTGLYRTYPRGSLLETWPHLS